MRQLLAVMSSVIASIALIAAMLIGSNHRERANETIRAPLRSALGSASASPHKLASGANVSAEFHADLESLKLRLSTAPNDTSLLLRLARLLDDSHQPGDAAIYYERYAAINPSNRQVWLDLAGAYAAQQSWQAALSASRSLLAIDSSDATAMYNLGAIYANMGRNEDAHLWWEKVKNHSDHSLAAKAEASLERLSNKTR